MRLYQSVQNREPLSVVSALGTVVRITLGVDSFLAKNRSTAGWRIRPTPYTPARAMLIRQRGADDSGPKARLKAGSPAPRRPPVVELLLRYDDTIMMSRTQITLDPEIQRRARKRAGDLGVSLAEYLRRLVARDLGGAPTKADPAAVFDLGSSGGCNIAKDKDAMIAEAFVSAPKNPRAGNPRRP